MKEGDDRMRSVRKIKRMIDIGFTVCKRGWHTTVYGV